MTATSKALFLPVPSVMRLPARQYSPPRQQSGAVNVLSPRQDPVSLHQWTPSLNYNEAGQAANGYINGTIIDLYA